MVVVRGHQATPWELRPWELLRERFDVMLLRTRRNAWDVEGVELETVPARTALDPLPAALVRPLTLLAGDRYRGLGELLRSADVVHAEELGYWFAADAARARRDGGFKLVQTVWETLPLLEAWRTPRARAHRAAVLEHTDLFLAATGRARDALLLEGVAPERVEVCPPGIDVGRFAGPDLPRENLVVSPGRLVWEKGHQDAIRALALMDRGLVPGEPPRLRIAGQGPEEGRLRAHAEELSVGHLVEIEGVSYDEMPQLLRRARALVLMSLPSARGGLHPLDRPRVFWEEQFGMVLAEAMAARAPIVAADSGAIREVTAGAARLVPPGDWRALAEALAAPGELPRAPSELVERYSTRAAAERLARAYNGLLGLSSAR